MKFVIAIEAGTAKEAFGVVVPDLPGCFSAGDTVEEAFDNAREAIEAHCEAMAADGVDLPKAKGLAEWQKDASFRGWTWGLVEVPVEKLFGPAEKINITVPAMTLRYIDSFVSTHNETRSGFLVRAAQEAIHRTHSLAVDAARSIAPKGGKHSAASVERASKRARA